MVFKVCPGCLPQAPPVCTLTDPFPFPSRCSLLLSPALQTGEDAAVGVSIHQLLWGRVTQLSVSLMP